MGNKGYTNWEKVDFTEFRSMLSLSTIPITIREVSGQSVYELSQGTEFCARMCEAHSCRKGKECPFGLSNIVCPVLQSDRQIGYVESGGVLLLDTEYKKYLIDISGIGNAMQIDAKEVAAACAKIPMVTRNQYRVHQDLIRFVAATVTERLNGHPKPVQSIEKDIVEKKMIAQKASDGMIEVDSTFLFNMLNCLARIAYFENAEKTEELIYCLSDLLRYKARGEDVVNSISEEIRHVDQYLQIQKARFQNRLKYSIEIPENLKAGHILNSLLLPLVDNALVHGVLIRRDGGEIRITAEGNRNRIIFYIIDTGAGFPAKMTKVINDPQKLRMLESSLGKLQRRIEAFYGPSYGLEVVKADESGSTVSLTIPKQRSEM